MTVTLTKAQLNDLLTGMKPDDKIEIKPSGKIEMVKYKTKQDILNDKYRALIGQGITLSEASEKYHIPRPTIQGWYYKNYIDVVEDSYPMKMNEADIAYCADVYRQKKSAGIGFRGAPLLDEDGLPYELKREGIAIYRRNKKH